MPSLPPLPAIAGLAFLAALSACSSPDVGSDELDATGTTYYEMTSRLTPADRARWDAARATLIADFDDVCPDTYCSGDYTNLDHVSLGCSITQSNYVKECTWVLAGNIDYVDGATGKYAPDVRVFACTVPIKAKVGLFLTALEEELPSIRAPLPDTGASFYDSLGTCLAGVVGKPPPAKTGDAYVDILDYLNDHSDSFPWFMVRRHLPEDLAEVCADSLCQGAYHDLSGLGIACSTEAATGTVGSCLWTIAGANLHVTTKGKVSAKTKVFGCPIALQGSADAVLGVLGGPDPLNAPLPGSGTTLMTQLDACLP